MAKDKNSSILKNILKKEPSLQFPSKFSKNSAKLSKSQERRMRDPAVRKAVEAGAKKARKKPAELKFKRND